MRQRTFDVTEPRPPYQAPLPIWKRLYMGRVIACAVAMAMIALFALHVTGVLSQGREATVPSTQDGMTADGTGMQAPLRSVGASSIMGSWDADDLDIAEWAYVKPLRVAHQKNSAERVSEASAFDAIEVDLRGMTDDGNDFKLLHDVYHGYTLRQFLNDCKRSHQIAVLDMKYDADPAGAVTVVEDEGMIGQTVFQVASGRVAQAICSANGDASCWLLNGAGEETGLREDELRQYADYLTGVNICGSVVGSEHARDIIATAHSITGRDGTPLDICIFAYGTRTDVYGNDDLYTGLGVDCLMTDVCPERARRAITEID